MLQKSSLIKILSLFMLNPTTSFYLLEISKKINLAHTSVKRCITDLIKNNLVIETIEKKGRRTFPLYKANINSLEFKKQKKIFNYQVIMESGIIEFLGDKLVPKSIVLFGSFQKGDDIEDSDIDLFVECSKEKIDLKIFEKKLNRKIQVHFNENFSSYPKELKNNIVNGIVLYGFLEVFK